ncbi:hypothetical protein BSKO_13952 [Bryopsis sp. KO-2023]|nr:hypothetical protein BSKO_13952 [Bryopsis sp. KO-2023]
MTTPEEIVEQTLHICREVHIFKIPPRPAAGGFRSGEWRIADKIFTGRLRMVAVGETCELRIEDTTTSELFAVCPVEQGKREIVVEPVTDSSRYFVLRVEDPTTKRHAFLGMGFDERGDAFDFSAALADHERHVTRGRGYTPTSGSTDAPVEMSDEIAALYRSRGDLSLKEGQTIHVNIKTKAKTGQGFLARKSFDGTDGKILAPPPLAGKVVLPPPATNASPPENSGWATFE